MITKSSFRIQFSGKVREVWVCDSVEGRALIRGIIDELKIIDNQIVVRDTKTRREPKEPGFAQKRTSAIQLLTYDRSCEALSD